MLPINYVSSTIKIKQNENVVSIQYFHIMCIFALKAVEYLTAFFYILILKYIYLLLISFVISNLNITFATCLRMAKTIYLNS